MISIIVPVYNTSALLPRCIESIQAQTYEDWELILIDDGSKDNSFALCEAYAAADPRIRAFSQPNRGVSAARNRGLSLARGRYLQFVDSDDYIDSDMLRQMHDTLERERADVVICGCVELRGETERILLPDIEKTVELQELAGAYPDLFSTPLINSPCNKLYKRTLIETPFPTELSMGEDLMFNLDVLRRCSRLSFLRRSFYRYEKQAGSLSDRERPDTAEIAEKLYLGCMDFARELGFGPQTEIRLSTTFVTSFCYGISTTYRNPRLSPEQKKQILRSWAADPHLRQALQAAQMPQLRQRVVQTLMKCRLIPVLHLLLQHRS